MGMKYEDILTTVYQNEFNLDQFSMSYDINGNFYINSWNVAGIAQPSNEQILAMANSDLEYNFNCNKFFTSFVPVLNEYFDKIALQRNYDSSLSIISYLNSSNNQWKNESIIFSSWRDSVWNYIIQQQQNILNKKRSIPENHENLLLELPIIQWPQ